MYMYNNSTRIPKGCRKTASDSDYATCCITYVTVNLLNHVAILPLLTNTYIHMACTGLRVSPVSKLASRPTVIECAAGT